MPILLKPQLKCNMRCDYCYESNLRGCLTKEDGFGYDLDKIIDEADKQHKRNGGEIVLHGGEITMLSIPELEKLLSFSFEKTGRSSLQTNGITLTPEHLELFKKYKTSVGVSIDGPWPLNKFRIGGTMEHRKKKTELIMENIEKMIDELGPQNVSIISVISAFHGEETNLELYKGWIKYLRSRGVVSGRMNPIQLNETIEGNNADISEDKILYFYKEMAELVFSDPAYMWLPFRDIVDNLLGLGTGTCTFTKCDLYNTAAAYVITGHGHITTCLHHSAEEGKILTRSDSVVMDRTELLGQTPQEYNGCKGCRYWKICYGYCPTSAIDGDWRNRSVHCNLFKVLFELTEKKLKGLMPNINLITDQRGELYEERLRGGLGNRTFEAMLAPILPSSWRGGWQRSSQSNNRNTCSVPKKVEDGPKKSAEELCEMLNIELEFGQSAEQALSTLGWIQMENGVMPDGTVYSDNGHLEDIGGWQHADHTDFSGN